MSVALDGLLVLRDGDLFILEIAPPVLANAGRRVLMGAKDIGLVG